MNIWRPLWGLIKLGPIHICDWSYWAVWRLLGKVPQHQKEVITSLYNKSWRSPPISEWRSQGWPVKAIRWAWNVANLKLYFSKVSLARCQCNHSSIVAPWVNGYLVPDKTGAWVPCRRARQLDPRVQGRSSVIGHKRWVVSSTQMLVSPKKGHRSVGRRSLSVKSQAIRTTPLKGTLRLMCTDPWLRDNLDMGTLDRSSPPLWLEPLNRQR